MKRVYICCFLLLMAVAGFARSGKTLYILHTNDTHSRIEPFAADYQNKELAGKAGFVRRAALVKEERARHKDLLLLDSGDFSQGTPYYNMFRGDVEVGLMNEMEYDVATIGNHEFDFGLDNMARLFRMAKFPVVCANYDVAGTVLEGLVKRYVVLNRSGLRIGVFGLGAPLEGLVAAECYGGVRFQDPISVAQEMVSVLKGKEHCDVIICLSHLGWKNGAFSDVKLIAGTDGIDVVLGGHSHSYFTEPVWYANRVGKRIPLQQMGKNGAFVGKMVLNLQKSRKK